MIFINYVLFCVNVCASLFPANPARRCKAAPYRTPVHHCPLTLSVLPFPLSPPTLRFQPLSLWLLISVSLALPFVPGLSPSAMSFVGVVDWVP